MAQLERPQKPAQLERPQKQQVDASKAPTIHTMEQLLRAGEASKPKLSPSHSSGSSNCSSPSSPFFQRMRHHDTEEEHGQNNNQKKSVLTKVKEKAKKLRHSLSNKKRHEDGNSTSPSWGTQEGDGVEEDAEYHGAPMYESEKAPEGYTENARQQPRVTPIFPQKHVSASNDKPGLEQIREKKLSRSLSKKTAQTSMSTPNSPRAAAAAASTATGPKKIMTKTIADKNLTPTYAEGSEAAHSITSKYQGLTLSKHSDHLNSSSMAASAAMNRTLSRGASRTPPAKMPSQTCSTNLRNSSAGMATPPPSPPASAPAFGKNSTSPNSQIWDKGVSVREYFMNKFEPGEDDKALSQVISEAMSPRRTPGDVGVIEKVREAVTSLLRTEEPTKNADTNTTTTTTRASSQLAVSSNAQEVAQEENHGRVLQTN